MTADLSALPDVDTTDGSDSPDDLGPELLAIIEAAIARHPRSLQDAPGPSDLGSPCARRIAYATTRTPKVNAGSAWLPAIGTAMHTQLDEWFAEHNTTTGQSRFLLGAAFTLTVGAVAGQPITGHGDLYDRATQTVIDWKVVGKSTLDKYRKAGNQPTDGYRRQVHLYGRGWAARGLPVRNVALMFLPRNGLSVKWGAWWHEPYDEAVAIDSLHRANRIHTLAATVGMTTAAAITAGRLRDIAAGHLADPDADDDTPALPTADDYCDGCPWWMPAATELSEACPGHR